LLTLAGCLAGGMGGGDVKLAAGIGLWLGLYRTWLVFILAAVLGLCWGLLRLYRQRMLATWWEELRTGGWRQRHLPEDDAVPPPPGAVPFGACLAVAAWVVVLYQWL
ncbi:MAG: prepilin peptidase, partial [Bacillota bacterium]